MFFLVDGEFGAYFGVGGQKSLYNGFFLIPQAVLKVEDLKEIGNREMKY